MRPDIELKMLSTWVDSKGTAYLLATKTLFICQELVCTFVLEIPPRTNQHPELAVGDERGMPLAFNINFKVITQCLDHFLV